MNNRQEFVYLDYNATAPIRGQAAAAVARALMVVGNPSSVHRAGRGARAVVEDARRQVAELAGVLPADVVFTSGGTEANNLAVRCTGARRLFVSAVEHESGLAAARAFAREQGPDRVHFISVDKQGRVDLAQLEELLSAYPSDKSLISVMGANNETGTLQPLAAIGQAARKYGARFHADCVQLAGKASLTAAGIDYMSLSAHKLGGPHGVGALVLSPGAPLAPLVVGGGQELGRRSGTENIAGLSGFGEAALIAHQSAADTARVSSLRDRMEAELAAFAPDTIIVGQEGERLANTSCLILPGMKGETQVMHMDLNGVCVSSGSACSSGKVKTSHVLTAMGYDETDAVSSIRVSLGYATNETDIDRFLEAYKKLVQRAINRTAKL